MLPNAAHRSGGQPESQSPIKLLIDASNVHEWSWTMAPLVESVHPSFTGSIARKNEGPRPIETSFDIPDFAELWLGDRAAAPDASLITLAKTAAMKAITSRNEAKGKAAAHLESTLTEQVKERLTTHDDYREFHRKHDFIGMYTLILDVFLNPKRQTYSLETKRQIEEFTITARTDLYIAGNSLVRLVMKYRFLCTQPPSNAEEEELSRIFIRKLDAEFATFKNDELKLLGLTTQIDPLTLPRVVEHLQNWAKDNLEAVRATDIKATAMLGTTQPPTSRSTQDTSSNPCYQCGQPGHRRPTCPVKNPWCTKCEAEGKPAKISSGHTTEAHRGPLSKTSAKTSKKKQSANAAFEDSDSEFAFSSISEHTLDFVHHNSVTVHLIAGDGHCAYRAIGRAFGIDHMILREIAANFIDTHWDVEAQAGMTWGQRAGIENPGLNRQTIVSNTRSTQYGGSLEILAIEQHFQRPIAIYTRIVDYTTGENPGFRLLQGPSIAPNRWHPTMLTWSKGNTEAGNHYDILTVPGTHTTSPTLNTRRSYADVASGRLSTAWPHAPVEVYSATTTTCAQESDHETQVPDHGTPLAVDTALSQHDAKPTDPHTSPRPHVFYIDSGATSHLIDSRLVQPSSPKEDTEVHGISGSIHTSKGIHNLLGPVLVDPQRGGRNLISLSRLRTTHNVQFFPERNEFTASKGDSTLVFTHDKGLYVLKNPEMVLSASPRADTQPTVAQLSRFRRALELHEALHHPSDKALIHALRRRVFIHDTTPDDIKGAREHFGPCIACLAGKATAPPAPSSTTPLREPGTALEADILFLDSGGTAKSPFLLCVDVGSSFGMVRRLDSRKAPHLAATLIQMVDDLDLISQRKVKAVKTDSETGFEAIVDSLSARGITLRIMPAERHARLAERVIREVKNYIRSTIHHLNFKLPPALYPYLIMDAITTRNLLPHRGDSLCPREQITGIKPDVKCDFPHPFGTVGYTQTTGSNASGDMAARAELAVVVGHYINEHGCLRVWLPRSGRFVKRHSITPIKDIAAVRHMIEGTQHNDSQWSDTTGPHHDGVHDDDDLVELDAGTPQPAPPSSPHQTGASIAPEPSPSSAPILPSPSSPVSHGIITADPSLGSAPTSPSPSSPTSHGAITADSNTSSVPGAPAASQVPPAPSVGARPKRSIRPPTRLIAEMLLADHATPRPDGNLTIAQAELASPTESDRALRAELQQMLDLEVIVPKDNTQVTRTLPSKMFLKWKSPTELKARLVIGGHLQDKSDMGDTYSSTVNTETVNLVLAVASLHDLSPYTLDVSGAFLHVPLTGPRVHMRLGKRVTRLLLSLASRFGKDVSPDGSLTVRVNKAIYGLGESSRQWKDHLAKTLSESGYSALRFDSSTYAKRAPDGSPTSIICTHVDDLLVVDWEPDNRASLIESLTRKYGKVKLQIGPEFVYLGLHITQRGRAFHLDQRSLITLLDYPRPNREPSSPANPDILDTDTGAAPAHDAASFRSTLMRLLYITTKTRFDLMFATNILASRQQACTRDDEAALSQLVAYVKRTADFDYVISPSNDTLDASADASYACHRDGKGHTGVVCSLGGTTIYARSAKQRLVAKSSTEAELLALNAATDEVLFLRNMLTELGRPPPTATIIWQDNLSAITLAQRGELGTKRTKHFTVRHYFVSHHIALGNVALRYQAGASIAADGLTKPVTGAAGLDWATLLLTGKSSSRDNRARGGVLRQDSAASYEPTRTDPRESL